MVVVGICFYIFAYCGLVGNPHLTGKTFFSPLPTSTKRLSKGGPRCHTVRLERGSNSGTTIVLTPVFKEGSLQGFYKGLILTPDETTRPEKGAVSKSDESY